MARLYDWIRGIPVPKGGEGNDVVADLQSIAEAMGFKTVNVFDTIADRDAFYQGSPPELAVCGVKSENALYVRAGGKWAVLWVDRPFVEVMATSAQSMPQATATTMTYASAIENTGGMWNTSARDRLTCKVAGVYMVTIVSSFAQAASTGSRIVLVLKNGSTHISFAVNLLGTPTSEVYTLPMRLAVGDYVQVQQYQSSGASATTYNQSYPRLAATML